jgi:hypothetical protein
MGVMAIVRTHADGFGRWYASVSGHITPVAAARIAREAIKAALEERAPRGGLPAGYRVKVRLVGEYSQTTPQVFVFAESE